MKYFFKSSEFKVILSVLAILVAIFVYTRIVPNDNLVENVISYSTVYAQKAFAKIENFAEDYSYQFREKAEIQDENEKLRSELNALRDKTVDYYNLKSENARYRKYYDLKKSDESLEFVEADVIGKNTGVGLTGFMIGVGSNDGVSVGDAVITENGFVGSVCKVTKCSSQVKTILSADCKIGAVGSRSGETGVLSGNIKFSEQGLTRMGFISAQNDLAIGEIVVTSGIGGMYPKNLKIGEVKSKAYDDYESFYYATIEPFQSIKDIKHVFVITNFAGKGKIEALQSEN